MGVFRKTPHDLKAPDVLILDPPRDGLHPKSVSKLIGLKARRIVYVSCQPTSLARDLPFFLAAGYVMKGLSLHDMFPRTVHVESVVLLQRHDT